MKPNDLCYMAMSMASKQGYGIQEALYLMVLWL